MEIWKNNQKWMIWEIALFFFPALLLLVAMMHQFQLDASRDVYTGSMLVGFEILLILTCFVLCIANIVILLLLMFKRKFLMVCIHIFQIITSFLLIISAMYIDSPTLIYMT